MLKRLHRFRHVFQLASTLLTLIKQNGTLEKKLAEAGLSLSEFPEGKVARGKGCDYCLESGYVDRTAIYEMMPITESLRSLIVDRASASVIKRAAMEQGLITLRGDGIRKVKEGMTTIQEVLRVTQMDIE